MTEKIKPPKVIEKIFLALGIYFVCSGIFGFGLYQVWKFTDPLVEMYLTPADAEQRTPMGTIGKLTIRDLKIFLPLDGEPSLEASEQIQTYVDAKEKAAIFRIDNVTYIADHNYQGFKRLPWTRRGVKAELSFASGEVIELQCIATGRGWNEKTNLTLHDGTPISDIVSSDDLVVMYTCLSADGHAIFLSVWEPIAPYAGCN